MAASKIKQVWYCTSCGNEYAKWMGRCPACGEWNTIVEHKVAVSGGSMRAAATAVPGSMSRPRPLS